MLNMSAFGSSNDSSHSVSVILMNRDQFSSSNGSTTQMSAVMEVMISNSAGVVSIINNPSINILLEYPL